MEKILNVGSDYLLIRGGVSVGKTTISNKLRDHFNGEGIPSVCLHLDLLKAFYGDLASTYENKLIAIKACVPLANHFLEEKYFLIIEGVLFEDDLFNYLIENVNGNPTLVRLTCNKEVTLQRDRERKVPLGKKKVINSPNWYPDIKERERFIDTSDGNIEDIIKQILLGYC